MTMMMMMKMMIASIILDADELHLTASRFVKESACSHLRFTMPLNFGQTSDIFEATVMFTSCRSV